MVLYSWPHVGFYIVENVLIVRFVALFLCVRLLVRAKRLRVSLQKKNMTHLLLLIVNLYANKKKTYYIFRLFHVFHICVSIVCPQHKRANIRIAIGLYSSFAIYMQFRTTSVELKAHNVT